MLRLRLHLNNNNYYYYITTWANDRPLRAKFPRIWLKFASAGSLYVVSALARTFCMSFQTAASTYSHHIIFTFFSSFIFTIGNCCPWMFVLWRYVCFLSLASTAHHYTKWQASFIIFWSFFLSLFFCPLLFFSSASKCPHKDTWTMHTCVWRRIDTDRIQSSVHTHISHRNESRKMVLHYWFFHARTQTIKHVVVAIVGSMRWMVVASVSLEYAKCEFNIKYFVLHFTVWMESVACMCVVSMPYVDIIVCIMYLYMLHTNIVPAKHRRNVERSLYIHFGKHHTLRLFHMLHAPCCCQATYRIYEEYFIT